MFPRTLVPSIQRLASQYPVVTIVGPRQSGKSTISKMAFPDLPMVNLERPDQRERIAADPLQFIQSHTGGCIIDEIQHLPELMSFIQVAVDERQSKGEFILIGSQQFQLMDSVSQSLAGRTAIVQLLPLSYNELERSGVAPDSLDELMLTGGYPRIYADNLDPSEALSFYVQTYLERDVRSIVNVRDLSQFERFLKLCAARCAQLVNATSIGNDAAIDQNTVQRWLSALEASFIVFRLQPHFNNLSKRIIKSPKLYFYDTGLLCFLLNLRNVDDLIHHPLRGSIFENFVATELIKDYYNSVQEPNLYFFRDRTGNEVDFIIERGAAVEPLEVKASTTFSESFLDGIRKYRDLAGPKVKNPKVIYAGNKRFRVQGTEVVPWTQMLK